MTHPLDGSWAREVEERGQPHVEYRATSESVGPWLPSIHMPRWASRIFLEVTEVRVERLQAISEEDACAEGVPASNGAAPTGWARQNFADLWDEINGVRAPWASNPWVWAITFRRVQP